MNQNTEVLGDAAELSGDVVDQPVTVARFTFAVAMAAVAGGFACYQVVAGWRLWSRPAEMFSARSPGIVVLYAAVVAILGAWAIAAPRRWLAWAPAVAALVAVGTVAFVAIRGHQVIALTMAAATLTASWWVGDVLLRRQFARARMTGVPSVALALGYSVMAVVILLVGLAGGLRAWTVGLGVVVLGVVGLVGLLRRHPIPRLDSAETGRLESFGVAVVAVTAAFGAVWTAAPEIQFDAVHYKAWLPQLWAHEGRIRFPLIHPVGNMFGSTYVMPIPGHLMGGDAVGRWLEYLLTFCLAGVLWRVARRAGSNAYRGLAPAIFVATPHVVWQLSTAYDDITLCLLIVALALAILHASPDDSMHGSVVIGLLAGGAFIGKAHLATFAAVAVVSWILWGAGSSRVRRAAAAIAGALVIAAPLTIARWIATGNPLFPQFNKVFRSRHYPPVNETFNFPFADGGFGALLRLPFRVASNPSLFMEGAPPGAFGMLLIPALAAPLAAYFGGSRARLLIIPLVATSALWWIEMRYLRYLLPYSLVGLVLLAPLVAGVTPLVRQRVGRSALSRTGIIAAALVVVVTFPSTMATFWNIPERFPWRVALGTQTTSNYLHRALPASLLIEAINVWADPGDHVVGTVAYPRTLIDPGIAMSTEREFKLLLALEHPVTSTDPDVTLERWQSQGATFLATSARDRLRGGYEAEIALLLAQRAELVWADAYRELYRLTDVVTARTAIDLCDPTFDGSSDCWQTPLDSTKGLTASEAPNGAIQTVDACGGQTFVIDVSTGGNRGEVAITLRTADADGELIGWEQVRLPAGDDGYLALTAGTETSRISIVLRPLDGAIVESAAMSVVPQREPCAT